MQADHVPIALFQISEVTTEMKCVDLYQEWDQVDRSESCEIPTREQLMAETFWSVYFDSFNTGFYEPWNAYCGSFRNISDWGCSIYINCSISGEIYLYWDQKGVRFVVEQIDDSYGILQKASHKDMQWLLDRYNAGLIEFNNERYRMPNMIIKYSDKPFDWLYTVTPKLIHAFAKLMYEDAWGLHWHIVETIGDQYEAQSA